MLMAKSHDSSLFLRVVYHQVLLVLHLNCVS